MNPQRLNTKFNLCNVFTNNDGEEITTYKRDEIKLCLILLRNELDSVNDIITTKSSFANDYGRNSSMNGWDLIL